MKSSKQYIQDLIEAYLRDEAKPAERAQLERLYAAAVKKQAFVDDMGPDELNELKQQGLMQTLSEIRKAEPKGVKLWPRIAAVSMAWKIAAAVAAICFGIYLFNSRHVILNSFQDPGSAQYSTDIKPGKNTATLTLANGEVINLSDTKNGVVVDANQLTYSDGTVINSSLREGTHETSSGQAKQSHQDSQDEIASIPRNDEEARTLAVSTPRGGTYQVVLSDGTRVWLNADSKISFPSQFTGRERKIMLNGEAYMEVAKDRNHPFIVESKGQVVEVLGTHFNISAYGDEPVIKTTLIEGSVKVTANHHSKTLKPNQQALLTGTNAIQVSNVEAEYDVAWKNGFFLFNGERLESIMAKVARWYNVEIEYTDPALKSKTFIGTISRFAKVSKVLNMLERTDVASFKIEGNKIIIDRKK